MNTLQCYLLSLTRILHQTFKHYLIVLDLFESVPEVLSYSNYFVAIEAGNKLPCSLNASRKHSHLDLSISADITE